MGLMIYLVKDRHACWWIYLDGKLFVVLFINIRFLWLGHAEILGTPNSAWYSSIFYIAGGTCINTLQPQPHCYTTAIGHSD